MPGTVTAPERERRNKVASLAISAWSPDDSVRNSVKTRKCDFVLGCGAYLEGQKLLQQVRERRVRTRRLGFRLTGLLTTRSPPPRSRTRSKGSSGPALALRLRTALSSSISSSSSTASALDMVTARVTLGLEAGCIPAVAALSLRLPLRLLRPLAAEVDSSCIASPPVVVVVVPSLNSRLARKGGGVFCPAWRARAIVTGDGGTVGKGNKDGGRADGNDGVRFIELEALPLLLLD